MRQLLLILNVKANTFLKTALDFRWQSVLKGSASALIFGGFALGVFFLSRGATAYLLQHAHIGLFLFHRFLSMLLYVFFITVNLGNMIVCYATLYRSEEVKFMMGMPISHQKIFVVKFIDNFFYSSSTLWLLGLSMLLGYGSFFNMPWHFYFLTMFAMLLPFMLVAGMVAVMILMGLIKIASRIGIRWLLAVISVLYFGAIYIYFRITNPVQLVAEVMKHYPNVNEYFGYLDPPFVRYLPNHWVSEFLYWTINGDSERALPYFFILILTTIGLMIVAWLLAQRYYYSSWLTANGTRASIVRPAGWFQHRILALGRPGIFAGQTDVIAKRDFWLFFREPSQWLHMLLMLLLMGVFLIAISSLELRLTQPLLQMVTFLVIFLFNGFLIASICLRFVFPLTSLEGEPFWSVRAAPVPLRTLYMHKFVFSFIIVLLIAEVLAILSNTMLRDDWPLVLVSAICAGCVALGLTGVNLGAGALFANYREKNPIRIASSQGASLTFLTSMIYLAMVVAVLAFPVNSYFEQLILRGRHTVEWMYLPVAVVAIISLALFALSTGIGLRALRRDF